MLGSLAAFEIDNGDPVTGLRLAGQAQEQSGGPLPPTPQAWLAALHALGHAASQDGQATDAALGRAEAAVDAPGAQGRPAVAVAVPLPTTPSSLGDRALACVRLGRAEQALAAFAQSLSAAQPAPKQRAVLDALKTHRRPPASHRSPRRRPNRSGVHPGRRRAGGGQAARLGTGARTVTAVPPHLHRARHRPGAGLRPAARRPAVLGRAPRCGSRSPGTGACQPRSRP